VTVRNQPRPCREDEGYAHPDDLVDRLGRLFVSLRIGERHGITFERYLQQVRSGQWKEVIGQRSSSEIVLLN
jgi:hypothetical protein